MVPNSLPKITFCEYLGSSCVGPVGSGRWEECSDQILVLLVLPVDLSINQKHIWGVEKQKKWGKGFKFRDNNAKKEPATREGETRSQEDRGGK